MTIPCSMSDTYPVALRNSWKLAVQKLQQGDADGALEHLQRESLEMRVLLLMVPEWGFVALVVGLGLIIYLRFVAI
jgi:hypothetical protein